MQVVLRLYHALHSGQDHRHIFGAAAGHDSVYGHLLGGDHAAPDGLDADDVGGLLTRPLQELKDLLFGRWDDWEAVGPALPIAELDGVFQGAGHLEALGDQAVAG